MSASPSPSHAGDDGRKRVAKACDRCRLKKIKCDGKVPCTRCKTEAAICKFGDRKKATERRVPPGYVEYLEDSHKTFVEAIKKLYREGHGASGRRRSSQERNVHSILEELGLVDLESRASAFDGDALRFIDNPEDIRAQFEDEGNDSQVASVTSESPELQHSPHKRAGSSTGNQQQLPTPEERRSSHVSPRTSVTDQQEANHIHNRHNRPKMSFPQGVTAFDNFASFPTPKPIAKRHSTPAALPTPQPTSGMDDSLWATGSSFFNNQMVDYDMPDFQQPSYAFDYNEGITPGLFQRFQANQDFDMGPTDLNEDLKWTTNSQVYPNSPATFGLAHA